MLCHSADKKGILCTIVGVVSLLTSGVCATVLPPDPDNAALLYYQAFLSLPEPNAAVNTARNNVLFVGEEPNAAIRSHVCKCEETIDLAQAASNRVKCNWGMRYPRPSWGVLTAQVRELTFLLEDDARVRTADGDFKSALDRCLSIHRFAGHLGDDTLELYELSISAEGVALRCMQNALGCMSPDVSLLSLLRGRLSSDAGAPSSPAKAFAVNLEMTLQNLYSRPDGLQWLREQLAARGGQQDLADDDVLALSREYYGTLLSSAFRAMESDVPYEQVYTELQAIGKRMAEGDLLGGVSVLIGDDVIPKFYGLQVYINTYLNAVKAAIEIYLSQADTARLPESLPPHLPKDLFSGEDFEYEITKDGFVLRCRAEDLNRPIFRPDMFEPGYKVHEFEFRVRGS